MTTLFFQKIEGFHRIRLFNELINTLIEAENHFFKYMLAEIYISHPVRDGRLYNQVSN